MAMAPLRTFALISSLVVGACATQVAADEARVHKDLEFATADGHSLKLDLYMPAASDPPLVVWIHGGGWRGGSKERCQVRWLTEHGYAVASISYRLTNKAIFPAQIHDCKAAVRWLRANADRFGYQSERVAVAGSSAGGHLAALMGTSGGVKELEGSIGGNLEHSSRVAAVVDFYGPTDFLLRATTQPQRTIPEDSPVFRLLGGRADEKRELAKLASPAIHITADDPPLLVFHGDQDKTVLLDQSQRISKAYKKAKLPVAVHVLKGAGHGGEAFFSGPQRELMVEFLDRYLRMNTSAPRCSPES
jgi:acetyl esterase/lipase